MGRGGDGRHRHVHERARTRVRRRRWLSLVRRWSSSTSSSSEPVPATPSRRRWGSGASPSSSATCSGAPASTGAASPRRCWSTPPTWRPRPRRRRASASTCGWMGSTGPASSSGCSGASTRSPREAATTATTAARTSPSSTAMPPSWHPRCSRSTAAGSTAPHILLAAGSRPFIPPMPGLDQVPYHTSDTVMRLDDLPERLVILGGGYIAAELGHVFGSLGSDVTFILRSPVMLRAEDAEVSVARHRGVQPALPAADQLRRRGRRSGRRRHRGHRRLPRPPLHGRRRRRCSSPPGAPPTAISCGPIWAASPPTAPASGS